jgi:UDP-glucose 4-epimerase
VKKKFALVTGGAGFIGSHLVDRLLDEGWHVRVIDNFSTGKRENLTRHKDNPDLEEVKGDLKSFEDCLKAVESVEVVFHFAANPEVRVSTTHPRNHFDENVVATFNLLEAIRQNKDVKRLVFASSSGVYGEPDTIPVGESAPIKPVSVYGATKAACENLIHAYSKLYGVRAVILRYANVVGPRMRHGVVYDFILKLRKNSGVLEILGDGKQIRSYLYVTDSVEATLTALNRAKRDFEVYNVGNDDWLTVTEVADIVANFLNLDDVRCIYKPVAHGIGWLGDVKRVSLDIAKIRSLGWKPKMSSNEAIRATVKFLSKGFPFEKSSV